MHSFVCNRAFKAACKATEFSVPSLGPVREQRMTMAPRWMPFYPILLSRISNTVPIPSGGQNIPTYSYIQRDLFTGRCYVGLGHYVSL